MWHWLRKNVQAIDPLIRTSVAVSLFLHLFIILLSLVMQLLKPAYRIAISKDAVLTTAVTIVIDPHAPVTGVMMQQRAQQSDASAPKKIEPKKPTTTVVSAPVVKAKPQKKQPVKSSKKQSPKSKPKVAPKKSEPKKIEKPAESDPPSSELRRTSATPRKAQPGPAEAAKLPVGSEGPLIIDGPIMIARNASDAAALAVHLEVQEALLQVWHPPVGIDDTVSCVVRVTIDAAGKSSAVELVTPSGMVLFDVSARAAVQQAVWPRGVWGTQLELSLQ